MSVLSIGLGTHDAFARCTLSFTQGGGRTAIRCEPASLSWE
jgi:hypothetical protein